jgi:hypothetical protein
MRTQTSFLATLATLAAAAFSFASLSAHAQSTEVSATGKGVVGGTLLGAEAVVSVEAAFKVQPAWAYLVGGLGGAVAGGIGGYEIEQNASAKVNLLVLASGMALAIPVTVAVLSATAYEPPASFTQDKGPTDEPVAEPPQPAATPGESIAPATTPTTTTPSGTEVTAPTAVPPVATPVVPAASPTPAPSGSVQPRKGKALAQHTSTLDYHLSPPALIGVSASELTLGVPAIELRDVYTRKEIAMFGVTQSTEVRVPVFNFLF